MLLTKTTYRHSVIILFLFSHIISSAQKNNSSGSPLKEGIYYAYDNKYSQYYKYIVKGDEQVEYNLDKGDTTYYKINYLKNGAYTLKYQSSTDKKTASHLNLLNNHLIAYEIVSATNNYFVYRIYLDQIPDSKAESRYLAMDTMWMKEPPRLPRQILFGELTENLSYLKKHFKDTSGYAIVYFYRPGKFMAKLNEYYVYGENNLVYWARNSTRYAIKVFREGPFNLNAKSGNTESKLVLDVKRGRKYYVQCLIHHKVSKATPELQLVAEAEGREGYESSQ